MNQDQVKESKAESNQYEDKLNNQLHPSLQLRLSLQIQQSSRRIIRMAKNRKATSIFKEIQQSPRRPGSAGEGVTLLRRRGRTAPDFCWFLLEQLLPLPAIQEQFLNLEQPSNFYGHIQQYFSAQDAVPDAFDASSRFLRLHRDTPHSITKISPMLMFGRSNTSGLPSMVKQLDNSEIHAKAVENDNRAKLKMKEHFDNVLKTRQPQIRVGSKQVIDYLTEDDEVGVKQGTEDANSLLVEKRKGDGGEMSTVVRPAKA
ncbi:hypothetical protein BpHYR1_015739, partial [Brachionus plicatilis]